MSPNPTPNCWICGTRISDSESKIEQNDFPVHESCYRVKSELEKRSEMGKAAGCASHKIETLSGELAIHFPGSEGLTKPIVWVFPKLDVCLVCGSTNFTIPEEQ